MIIDGEKYACEACVRGHRVSNCNHYERPLNHINKKGRPVSQCQHCRVLRKSRSSHVKCECGSKGKGDSKKCQCGSGGRCCCALKKEHLDTVPERGINGLARSRSSTDSRKPPLPSNHSDPMMAYIANGHHAPVHRKNNAGSQCGQPYRVPARTRPHSFDGGHNFGQRSTDSLPLSASLDFPSQNFANQEERRVRSEHGGSPGLLPVTHGLQQELSPLDLNQYQGLPISVTSSPVPSEYPSFPPLEQPYITTTEEQPSILSIEPVDWSMVGLDTPSDYPQAPSYASFDPTSHPGLTTASSSGDVSEAEEFISMHSPAPGCSPYGQFDEQVGTMGGFNMSTESLHSLTPPPMLSNSQMNSLSLEQFMRGPTPQSPAPYEDFRASTPLEHAGFPTHFGQEGIKPMHPGLAEARGPTSPMARPMPTSDPLWANSYGGEEPGLNVSVGVQEPVWTN